MRPLYLWFTLILIFFGATAVFGQWTKLSGQGGASIYCFAASGDTMYVGTSRGLVRSLDGGNTWKAVGDSLGNLSVHALQLIGTSVIAEAGHTNVDSRFFLSTNLGRTWSVTHTNAMFQMRDGSYPIPAFARVGNVVITSWSDDYHFSGNLEIDVSRDSGRTWNNVPVTRQPPFDALRSFGGFVYGLSDGQIFRSSDTGRSWSVITNLPITDDLCHCGGTLYQTSMHTNGDGGGSTLVSRDSGLTWSLVDTSGFIGLACVQNRLFGASGASLGELGQDNRWVGITKEVRFRPTTLFQSDHALFAPYLGLYRSVDSGRHWAGVYSAEPTGKIGAVGDLLVSSSDYSMQISSDEGINWIPVPKAGYVILPTRMGAFYLVSLDSLLERSTDTGKTWARVAPPSTAEDFRASLAADGEQLLLGTNYYGTFFSSDAGGSWTKVRPDSEYIRSVALHNQFLAVSAPHLPDGETSSIMLSNTAGMRWETALIKPDVVYSMWADDSLFLAATNKGVLYSIDEGTTMLPSAPDLGYVDAVIGHKHLYIAASSTSGVYVSKDRGQSWLPFGFNDPLMTRPRELAANDSFIYCASTLGVWRRSIRDADNLYTRQSNLNRSVSTLSTAAVDVNGRMLIAVNSSNAQLASLRIFDVLGRPIFTNQLQLGYGEQLLPLPALKPGGYYCCVEAVRNNAICKLIVAPR